MGTVKLPQCSIVAATDHEDVARRWIRNLEGMCEIFVASTIPEFQQYLLEYNPSVALIDLELNDSKEHLADFLKLSPSTKFLLYTRNYREEEALELVEAGAKGYAEIDTDRLLLRKAVDVVRKGELWIPRDLVNRLLADMQVMLQREREAEDNGSNNSQQVSPPPMKLNQLTNRESQIADLIANGYSNKEIANFLKISESTVKAHLSAIYHKLGLEDRLSLALFITQHFKTDHSEAAS